MGCEVVGESQDSVRKTQLTEERGEPKQIGTWVHLFTNQVPCYEAKWSCTIGSEVSEHGSQAISQKRSCFQVHHHHHHHISLKCEGRLGTTGDFATSFLYFPLFSTALLDLVNSRPVHSLVLSSHLFLCLPRLLHPFTVPCKMVLARPDEREVALA